MSDSTLATRLFIPLGEHLLIRTDGVLCTVCGEIEPVHPGNGTPMPTLLWAYEDVNRRHPQKPHERPHG